MANVGDILSAIEGLQKDIGELKNLLNSPEYMFRDGDSGGTDGTDLSAAVLKKLEELAGASGKEGAAAAENPGIEAVYKYVKSLGIGLKQVAADSAELRKHLVQDEKRISVEWFEINSAKTMVKFKADDFSLQTGKVKVSFVEYDKDNGCKLLKSIDTYTKIPELLQLCREIQFGIFQKKIEAERQKGEKYPRPIYQYIGGSSEKKAKREDKKAISRIWEIKPSSAPGMVLIDGKSGPGHSNEKGMIVPEFCRIENGLFVQSKRPETQILVQASYDSIIQLSYVIQMHVQAFYTSLYMDKESSVYWSKDKENK